MKLSLGLRAVVSASIFALLAGCAEGAADVDDAESVEPSSLASNVIAWSAPTGLSQSSANLYWTTSYASELGGTYHAAVFRAAKSAASNSEVLVYSESSASPVTFGDITWTIESDVVYGYFVASYGTTSQIKRVPLAGGEATIVATSPAFIGGRQTLATDGSAIYWADESGVRKVGLEGGAVTTLATVANPTGLGVDRTSVFVSAGDTVFSIAKDGGPLTWRASGTAAITSLSVFPEHATYSHVMWTEANGAVREKVLNQFAPDSVTQDLFAGGQGLEARAASVTYTTNGIAFAWTVCSTGSTLQCTLYHRLAGTQSVTDGVGAGPVRVDEKKVYWGNANALRRASY